MVVRIVDVYRLNRFVGAFNCQLYHCVECLNPESRDTGDVIRNRSELIPSNVILWEHLVRTGFENICEYVRAISTQLNVDIAVGRVAVTHRYPSRPRLRVVANRDDQ